MKKKFVVLMLVALMAGLAQAELLTNGGFEDRTFVANNVPDGWTAYYSASSSPNANWVKNGPANGIAQSGTHFLKLTGWSSGYWCDVEQNVAAVAGVEYTFSAWVKGSGAADDMGFEVMFEDSLGSDIGTIAYATLTSNTSWTEYTYSAVAPAGTINIEVKLCVADDGAGGAYTAWFDDVSLVPEPVTLSLLGLGALMLRRRK